MRGPDDGAPHNVLARTIRSLVGLLVIVAVAVVIVVAAALVPRGTDAGSLVARGALGLGIGIVGFLVVRRMLRALVAPPPPALPTVDARPADVVYECPVCGTRVRLEVAATAKAPKHCGEEMEPSIG